MITTMSAGTFALSPAEAQGVFSLAKRGEVSEANVDLSKRNKACLGCPGAD